MGGGQAIMRQSLGQLLGRILLGRKEKPANFFYHYCGMKLHPFALPKFIQGEGGMGSANLLTTPASYRVVAGARSNQGCKDNSSETGSISCELNEAMDIDALINGLVSRLLPDL
ncbi:hypothetical protein GOBAR_DD33013 [Gossypium barbadense]|nr:hypothetical protein GOBAR_DD33013 [Gossypium barbadense]